MADAFRGLTIRLGADARPLKSAIDSIKHSAGQAQSQLSKMSKALKLDPSNAAAMQSKLDLVGDKAKLAARETRAITAAMQQAARQTVEFQTDVGVAGGKMGKVAANARDVYSATQRLRSEYNHVDVSLAHIYEAAAKVKAAQDGISFEKALKSVKALAKEMESSEASARKLRSLVQRGTMGSDSTLRADFGLSGVNNIAASWKIATEVLDNYRARQRALQHDLEAMNKAEGFRAMRSALVAARAELREAAADAARLNSELHATDGGRLSGAVNEIRRMDGALEGASAEARQMRALLDAMPRSVEAMRAKAVANRAEMATLEAKLFAVNAAMDRIRANPTFDEQAADSEQAYVKAVKLERAYENLTYKLRGAEAASEKMRADLQSMRDAGVDEASADFQKLKSRVEAVDSAIAELKSRIASLDDSQAAASLVTQFRRLRTEAAAAEAQIAGIRAASSKLGAALNVGNFLREVGYGAYSTLTPAIMMAGRYAIQAAQDIDSAYRDMRKTVNGTEEQFEALRRGALEFSQTHVTTAEQILEIESIGGQLGIAATDLESFARTVSNLDIATNMDTEDIALDLAKLSNIMHFGQEQYDSFADALVRLGNNEPALESDIMAISTRFAGMAANVGMTTSDMLGLATAATATGQKAEAAGGSMQRTISRIEQAVAEGGEGLEAYARVSGTTAEEFARTWGDAEGHGPARAIQSFVEGLARVKREGGSVDATLAELGVNGVRDKQLLAGLTNTTDVLAESLKMAGEAWDGMSSDLGERGIEQAGDAMREAERKSEGFSGELGKMSNNAKQLANEMAEGATPIIHDLGQAFLGLTDAVKGMPAEMKTAAVGAAAFLAAIGPVGVWAGTTVNAIAKIGQGLGVMRAGLRSAGVTAAEWGALASGAALQGERALSAAGKAATGLGRAMQFLGSTGGMLAAAGVSVAVGLIADKCIEAYQNAEKLKAATAGFGEAAIGTAPSIRRNYDELSTMGEKARAASIDYQALFDQQAELGKSIEERNSSAQAEVGILQDALSVIDRYGGAAKLSAEQHAELQAAIEIVNEKLGTQYRLTSDVSGAMADEKGAADGAAEAIRNLVQARQEEILKDVYAQNYSDAYKQRLEDLKALAAAQQEYNEENAKGRYAGSREQYERSEWREAKSNLEEMKAAYASADEVVRFYSEALANADREAQGAALSAGQLASTMPELSAMFQGAFGEDFASRFRSFCTALDDAGVSMASFRDLNDDALLAMVSKWAETEGDITETMAAVGLSAQSLGQQMADALQAAGGDVDAFGQRVQQLAGGDVERFAQQLSDAGVTAQQFAQMGVEGFDDLLAAAEGDISRIGQAISLLNSQGVDEKDIVVTDGGTIDGVSGKLYQLDLEANAITDTGRTFRFTEEGLVEITGQLEQIEGQEVDATVNIDGDASGAEEAAGAAEEAAGAFADGDYEAEYGADETDAVDSAGTATDAINGIVTRPTLTNIGWTGEDGAEAILHMGHAGGAVVPLTNRRYVRPFARAVASEMGGGATVTNNSYAVYIDGKALSGSFGEDTTIGELARYVRRRNRSR